MRRPAVTAAMMGPAHAGQALGERTRRNSNFTTTSSARTRPVIQFRPRGHTQQKINRVGYSAGYKEQYRPPDEEMMACRGQYSDMRRTFQRESAVFFAARLLQIVPTNRIVV
ncbi:uncharacterized protein AKAW2_80225A [Aspergillus luchuensis]|uniref:Uncharacterized protein n=1 Tax=Aspergillus kawachii TaxID=1069201 RepID=A0A7R7WKX2_ASPKA|nr:uncharacterized protein AKAW2_80225A [Aspergillus luchuensis]BCS04424.1 hypothetical protein AKAW2_80225A [Aspergillus luchuensis]